MVPYCSATNNNVEADKTEKDKFLIKAKELINGVSSNVTLFLRLSAKLVRITLVTYLMLRLSGKILREKSFLSGLVALNLVLLYQHRANLIIEQLSNIGPDDNSSE
jgi:hypothetical protein